jgi:hypothetical protein
MHVGYWWGNLKNGDYLEEIRMRDDNIKMDLRYIGWGRMEFT